MTRMSLRLATTAAGNDLLARDPLALVIGMLLDQQTRKVSAYGWITLTSTPSLLVALRATQTSALTFAAASLRLGFASPTAGSPWPLRRRGSVGRPS